jgi:hypothetical protein
MSTSLSLETVSILMIHGGEGQRPGRLMMLSNKLLQNLEECD